MEKMAKSTIQSSPGLFRAELLFCDTLWRERAGSASWHRHPHWQVEIALDGPFSIRTDGGTVQLEAGDVALLPAGACHEFSYPDEKVGWMTLRFSIHGSLGGDPGTFILRHGGVVDGFVAVLRDLLERSKWPRRANVTAAAEHCIAGLVGYVCLPETGANRQEGQSVVQRANGFIAANANRRITVNQVAHAMGYSTSHAAALYRQDTGQSLKNAIDEARAESAQRQLVYSDQRIGEVAESMGFVDVYAFSRFMKRVTGKSPRQFRKTGFRTDE